MNDDYDYDNDNDNDYDYDYDYDDIDKSITSRMVEMILGGEP